MSKLTVLMDAENTVQVFDDLWCSGQLSAADFTRLPELGIATVINLALPTSSNALNGEAERVTALGLNYVQIPVEWDKPTLLHFAQFVGVMAAFGAQPVWLHCAKNMRASACNPSGCTAQRICGHRPSSTCIES